MIESIGLALIVGVIVGLLLLLAGVVLKSTKAAPLLALGEYCTQYAWAIGLIAGVLYFITGSPDFIGIRHR